MSQVKSIDIHYRRCAPSLSPTVGVYCQLNDVDGEDTSQTIGEFRGVRNKVSDFFFFFVCKYMRSGPNVSDLKKNHL